MKTYWAPDPARVASVIATLDAEDSVIEIGEPSFQRANDSIGPRAKWRADLNTTRFPFARNGKAFSYSRHTLAKLWNPVQCIQEMNWTARRGYVEEPSALAELSLVTPEGYAGRGGQRSRWVFWVEDRALHFVPKLPEVELSVAVRDATRERGQLLREHRNWNIGLYWEGALQWKMWDYGDWGGQTYDEILLRALRAYIP